MGVKASSTGSSWLARQSLKTPGEQSVPSETQGQTHVETEDMGCLGLDAQVLSSGNSAGVAFNLPGQHHCPKMGQPAAAPSAPGLGVVPPA